VREEESSEGGTQERIWHEIGPGSSGRMKAPGGCENLEAQAVGNANPTKCSRCPVWKDAVGFETSREALLVGVQHTVARRIFGELEIQGQQLGARVSSEEEPKPRRGARETKFCFLGGPGCENPGVRLVRAKDTRGASKQ